MSFTLQSVCQSLLPPSENDSGANSLESLPECLVVFSALPQWKHMLKDHKTPSFPPFPVLRSLLGLNKTTKKETEPTTCCAKYLWYWLPSNSLCKLEGDALMSLEGVFFFFF